jgi:ABC-type multidrug transport system fused ATPase/permease subunit
MSGEFWVQGADGEEYGPVPLETVAEWVREGRVTPATLVRTAALRPIAARLVPALRSAFAHLPPAPTAPSAGGPASAAAAPAAQLDGALAPLETARIPPQFDAVASFQEAFRLLKGEDYLLLSVQLLIMFLIQMIPYIGGCIFLVIGGPLWIGFWRSLLGRLDGRRVEVGALFSGFDRFGDAFLLQLVTSLVVAVPIVVLMVPVMMLAPRSDPGPVLVVVGLIAVVVAISISILFLFALPELASSTGNFWEAMKRSVSLGSGHRGGILLLLVMSVPVSLVGMLACCVGLLPAMTLIYTAMGVAYRSLDRKIDVSVFA